MSVLRARFHRIRNARIENVGKSQSCMVSKLRIIWKQTVGGSGEGVSASASEENPFRHFRCRAPPAEAAAYGVDRVDAKSPEKKQPRDSGSSGDEGWDEGGEGVDAKRQKRMRRNRESAAMSRERKKKHIDELEHKLAMLSSTVATLQAENDALRSRRAGAQGVDTHPPELEDLKQMTNTAALSMPLLDKVSFVAADLDASSLVLFAQELAGGCGISLPNSPAALFGAAGGGDDSVPFLLLNSVVCPPAAQVACAG